MKKFKVMERTRGFLIESQQDGNSWRKASGYFLSLNSANEKMRRMRVIEKESFVIGAGQQIVSSRPFCAGVKL